jgi:hypothetical protein
MGSLSSPPLGAALCDRLAFPRDSQTATAVADQSTQQEQAPLIQPVPASVHGENLGAELCDGAAEPRHQADLARPNIWWLVPSAVIGTTAQCMLTPILPQLMQQFFLTGHQAAAVQGWTDSVGYGLGFLAAGVVGKLSDCYGRKPVIAVQKLAATIAMATLAFRQQLDNDLWLYISARMLVNVVTGCSLYQPSAVWNAYLADCYPGRGRSAKFGVSDSSFDHASSKFSFHSVIDQNYDGLCGCVRAGYHWDLDGCRSSRSTCVGVCTWAWKQLGDDFQGCFWFGVLRLPLCFRCSSRVASGVRTPKF